MSAGWVVVPQIDWRMRLHVLAAGSVQAVVEEWPGKPGEATRCAVEAIDVRSELVSVVEWWGKVEEIDADKLKLEAEMRRVAADILAALGGAS